MPNTGYIEYTWNFWLTIVKLHVYLKGSAFLPKGDGASF